MSKSPQTLGEILDAVVAIVAKPDDMACEEARAFMQRYEAFLRDEAHDEAVRANAAAVAAENIGYLSGYCDGPTMDRIRAVFDVAHPVFGSAPAGDIAPAVAFEVGRLRR